MKPATALALISLTPALAGCDILDILQGKPTKAQRQYEAQQAVSLPADRQPDFTELYALSPSPITTDPPTAVAQAQPEPVPVDPGPPPFECVSIFRVQTCEDGVLYMLDSNMNWILPGRTE